MPRDDLQLLPMDVKALVNDGTYSLYEVKGRPGVAYVLLTNTGELYALSSAGEVVQGVAIKRLEDVEIGDPGYFPDLEPRPTLKLNYA